MIHIRNKIESRPRLQCSKRMTDVTHLYKDQIWDECRRKVKFVERRGPLPAMEWSQTAWGESLRDLNRPHHVLHHFRIGTLPTLTGKISAADAMRLMIAPICMTIRDIQSMQPVIVYVDLLTVQETLDGRFDVRFPYFTVDWECARG